MPFIGNKPSAVPLTSADIADSIITSAKITDGTITNSDVASSIITGQTAETSIAGADSVLIYDDSASALRKMTRTNFVSGIGGTNTPYFQATMTANQTMVDNTLTKITFNNEELDTASNYDPSTNYRFTPTTAGKYFISTTITHFNNTNGGRSVELYLYKNGSAAYGQMQYSNDSSSQNLITVTTQAIITFNGSSDYVEAFARIDVTAGSPDVDASLVSGEKTSIFHGFKLTE